MENKIEYRMYCPFCNKDLGPPKRKAGPFVGSCSMHGNVYAEIYESADSWARRKHEEAGKKNSPNDCDGVS